MEGNVVASAALILFIPYSIFLYRKLDVATATALTVLGATFFLPQLTLLEIGGAIRINKDRIGYLAAFAGMVLFHSRTVSAARPGQRLELLVFAMFLGGIGALQSNANPVVNESTLQEGLSFAWLIGQTVDDLFVYALPFVVGRTAFATIDDLTKFLRLVVKFGMIYTVLILTELIVAIPWRVFQFSHYIYGYDGGVDFRYGLTEPTVFMGNGHALATLMIIPLVASAALHRYGDRESYFGIKSVQIPLLLGLLSTLKVASNFFGLVAVVIIRLLPPKRIAFIAVALSILACLYPASRVLDLFPDKALVSVVLEFSQDRAFSLNGRFEEEEFVLGSLEDRKLFGWGHFGRIPGASTFYGNSGAPGLDAWWVIRTGMSGFFGLECSLLFFLVPIWKGRKMILRLRDNAAAFLLCGVMMCICMRAADLLLNGWWNSLPIFLAGIVYGIASQGEANTASSRPKERHSSIRRVPSSGA